MFPKNGYKFTSYSFTYKFFNQFFYKIEAYIESTDYESITQSHALSNYFFCRIVILKLTLYCLIISIYFIISSSLYINSAKKDLFLCCILCLIQEVLWKLIFSCRLSLQQHNAQQGPLFQHPYTLYCRHNKMRRKLLFWIKQTTNHHGARLWADQETVCRKIFY